MKNLHLLNTYESVDLVRVGADMYDSVIKLYIYGLFILCGLIAVSVMCLYFCALYLDQHQFTRHHSNYNTCSNTTPYQEQVLLNDPHTPNSRQRIHAQCHIQQPTQLDCDNPLNCDLSNNLETQRQSYNIVKSV